MENQDSRRDWVSDLEELVVRYHSYEPLEVLEVNSSVQSVLYEGVQVSSFPVHGGMDARQRRTYRTVISGFEYALSHGEQLYMMELTSYSGAKPRYTNRMIRHRDGRVFQTEGKESSLSDDFQVFRKSVFVIGVSSLIMYGRAR